MSNGNAIPVRLGNVDPDGVAALLHAVVARAADRRPALTRATAGELELQFDEVSVPMRIVFAGEEVLVEDGSSGEADVVIAGRLPDLAHMLITPPPGGVTLADGPGRVALARIATQQVRVQGQRMLARKLLALLSSET